MIAQSETRNPSWEIWCDRTVISGILFLTGFTPFAFGSVHPWAYSIMEAVIFVLVVVWMIKIALRGEGQRAKSEGQRAGSTEQRGNHRRAVTNSEIPKSNLPAPRSLLRAPGSLLPRTWLPLSLAPALTRTDILKFAAYGALFLLVLFYPFRHQISKSEI